MYTADFNIITYIKALVKRFLQVYFIKLAKISKLFVNVRDFNIVNEKYKNKIAF